MDFFTFVRNQFNLINHFCTFILLLTLSIISSIPLVNAHGCMHTPHQRGVLPGRARYYQGQCSTVTIDINAPIDTEAHFPAGPRTGRPGEGKRYQQKRAGPYGWVPFEPLKYQFRWRAGVCGDVIGNREAHRRGGKYYYNGKVVATYTQGGIVKVGLKINAHHNGFMELHLCDVQKCNGEISESCFRRGHCRQLRRAYQRYCDDGYHKHCGPIDRNYPGRWYFPCSSHTINSAYPDFYGVGGKGFIHYQLPRDFYSSHAVLQWFWTSANTCNPPGVAEYFKGPDRPRNWGRCRGQANAVGGYVHKAKPCGGRRFPEEYLQCADIRVLPRSRNWYRFRMTEMRNSTTFHRNITHTL